MLEGYKEDAIEITMRHKQGTGWEQGGDNRVYKKYIRFSGTEDNNSF